MAKLDERLAALAEMTPAMLRQEWERAYAMPAPRISAELLQMGIAWRLQEQQLGGFSRFARQALKTSGDAGAMTIQQRKLTAGTRLVRDWHGVGHTVTVVEDGFTYEDRHWPSLTAIARHITGAKWSGPRFFGLTGAAA